jgi:diacylglycerol kinase family enzyme
MDPKPDSHARPSFRCFLATSVSRPSRMSATLSRPPPPPPPQPWSRATIVLNRESGDVDTIGPEKLADDLGVAFREHGIAATIHLVPGAGLQKALTAARDDPSEVVIVGGGDGTVSAAVSVLAGCTKPLGVLPLGTFNIAARDLGVPLDWKDAVAALAQSPATKMDLLEVNGELYCCVVVLGFFPALKLAQPEHHGNWLIRAAQATTLALRSMATYPPLDLSLHLEGKELRHRTRFIIIANNDYEEMFGLIPRRTGIDGGFFTVYLSKHRTNWGMGRALLRWITGRFKQDRELTVLHTDELVIHVKHDRVIPIMLDGEVKRLQTPLRIRTRPKALRVLAPSLLAEETEKPKPEPALQAR